MKRKKTDTDFSVAKLSDFIALVREGTPIADQCREPCSHNEEALKDDRRRKDKFLTLGAMVMRELARLLGVLPELVSESVHVNRAGPVVSGDVYLSTSTYHVAFTHHTPRYEFGDVNFSLVNERHNRGWLKWEQLEDLDRCAEIIKHGCGVLECFSDKPVSSFSGESK